MRTSEAKSKIRNWFKKMRREENITQGRDALARELRREMIILPDAEWATLRQKIIPTTHLCIVVHRIDSGVKGTFDSTAEIRLLRI